MLQKGNKYSFVFWLCVSLLAFTISIIMLVGYNYGFKFSDAEKAFWDLVLKLIAGLIAIAGGSVTILKYFDEKENSNRTALLEAQKPFFEKRQQTYFDLVNATSKISNVSLDGSDRIEAEAKFWHLYWGALPMVTDELVGGATNEFEKAMCAEVLCEEKHFIAMRNSSKSLAEACRKSLGFE